MSRVVDPYRFYARAALTNWAHINRARDPQDQRWAEEWRRRGIEGYAMAQLRWSINPQLAPELPDEDYGMPDGPFTVWARLPSEKEMRDIPFHTYQNQDGATIVWWMGDPLVYVTLDVDVTAANANLAALNGPVAIDALEIIETVGTGQRQVLLWGTSIVAVAIASPGPVGVLSVRGITAHDYANSDAWRPLEIVGLPVEPSAWSDVGRHADKQGMVGALTAPDGAARDRLRRGAAPFGWPGTLGPNPAPAWALPDFDGLVKEVRQDLLPRLHPVLKMPPVLQARQRDLVNIPGPSGAGGTLGDPSTASLPPLGLAFIAAGSDPLLALALGFGTAYPAAQVTSGGSVTPGAVAIPSRMMDFMVTATWDKGMDGTSGPLEMAALAIGAPPPVRPPAPNALQAQAQSHSRPHAADQPWSAAARVSWDRLPRFKLLTTSSFAFARANPVTPAVAADAIMRPRPSGGLAPITLASNAKDKETTRHSAVDSSLVLPLTAAGLALRYGIALQDIWGQWSVWGTVDHADQQPALDRPRVLRCALDAAVPASGRVCAGTLTVELAWDWEVRRPLRIELRSRLFGAPQRSHTPPPDTTLPAGLQTSLAVPPAAPLVLPFSGDQVSPLPPNVTVDYFDIDGNLVAPGPVGADDVRRYRITVSGLQLDYNANGHIGVAVWTRVRERAQPLRDSAWLAPLVSGSAMEPGPNIAYASDPIPPAPEPPEIVKRASLADARGEHHARVSWAPAAGATGYFIYTATESAILAKVGDPDRPAPDPTQTYTERLAFLRDCLAASTDNFRALFTRVNTKAQPETSADLVLPRGTKEIHLFTMVAVNAGNVESNWPAPADNEQRVVAIAAADIATPAPPRLEIRRLDQPAATPKFAVHVDLASQPGARVARYQLFRTRVEAAAMALDTMGPPVAAIEATGGGWTVHGLDGDAAALADATGTDQPDGSWKKVWYRAVAWAHPDPDRALLPGRSPPSNAMSVVIPPDGPPNLSPLTAEWPGGPVQDVLVHFTSTAPVAKTALGPHKLAVDAQVLSGPSKSAPDPLLLEAFELQAVPAAPPAPPLSGTWRTSATQYALRLRRGSVDDRVAVVVRMTDPLGRTTERVLTVASGPVDPAPDVLDLEMHVVKPNVVNATWRSSAPIPPRAGGKYTIKVTVAAPKKPILTPAPVPHPIVQPHGVAALLAKKGVALETLDVVRGPIIKLPGQVTVIEMALADVPVVGKAPLPGQPWQLVRLNSAHGVTSYGLTYNGAAASVTVRITAPDGRFAEQVAK